MKRASDLLFGALLTLPALLSVACGAGNAGHGTGQVREVTSQTLADITTDRAIYAPGDTVKFSAEGMPAGATIRYRNGVDVIAEQPYEGTLWTWQLPADGHDSYLVDIYTLDGNTENILATIGVDASGDWRKYPRYGFVGTYDSSKLEPGVIDSEIAYLNRCHINGLQFYDWHYKHHEPMAYENGRPAEKFTDIANREIVSDVIRKYIDDAHHCGMQTMFYNLCFGALKDAYDVPATWYAYKDTNHKEKDVMYLGPSWKSSIYIVNPGLEGWQEYIGKRNDDVYAAFDFDGYHIDQLGNRGDIYDYDGNPLDLRPQYATFIKAMKERHPDKKLVMNAVASFGGDRIAQTRLTEFCYNELWGEEANFSDIYDVIRANDVNSGDSLRTVFAAYINYDRAHKPEQGEMNLPGVLMADAVIMALGGDHLELGDHMLSREYFPAEVLVMTDSLRYAMVRYYDFMTAYQDLLRGTSTSTVFAPQISTTRPETMIVNWPPVKDSVTAFAKNVGNRRVISLLNFLGSEDLSWRDLDATRPAPQVVTDLPVVIDDAGKVTRVWVASPDINGGAPQMLPFKQKDGRLEFTVPRLEYWTMIVVE